MPTVKINQIRINKGIRIQTEASQIQHRYLYTYVIIQNTKYVEPKNIVDRSTYFVEHIAMRNLITYVQDKGFEGLSKAMQAYIRSTDYERDLSDPTAARRRDALFSRIATASDIIGKPLPTHKVSGLWNNCGRLEVSL